MWQRPQFRLYEKEGCAVWSTNPAIEYYVYVDKINGLCVNVEKIYIVVIEKIE